MWGNYCKMSRKAEESPSILEPAALQGLISPSSGEKKARGHKRGKDEEQVPALAPSWLPTQGTARMIPARQTVAQLRLCWQDPSLLLPKDSPAPDPGLLGLLGDVQYMCRWKSGKAEDFINVKQEK